MPLQKTGIPVQKQSCATAGFCYIIRRNAKHPSFLSKGSFSMRVCFYTLGCKVNLNETGALEQLFRANGFAVAQELW